MNVLNMIPVDRLFALLREFVLNCGRPRIMSFGCGAMIFAISLFLLVEQLVELGLQLYKNGTQVGVTLYGLLQLFLELRNGLAKRGNGCSQVGVFFFQPCELFGV
jgi:hypothetical protein